jgi:hypothetical protein
LRKRSRATRPSVQPRPTSQLIDATFRWLRLDETARSFLALRAFSEVAGSQILRRARAERLRGAILYVRVASAAWSQELQALSTQLIEKIKARPGGEGVEALRFHVGDIEELPDFQPEASPAAAEALKPPTGEVAEAIEEIVDDDLRARFTRLVSKNSLRGASPER